MLAFTLIFLMDDAGSAGSTTAARTMMHEAVGIGATNEIAR